MQSDLATSISLQNMLQQTNEKNAVNNKNIMLLDTDTIRARIYFIRGLQVMLDNDLAEIYGVETKVFNQAVK